jgi:cell division protein FtsZ
VNEVAERIGQAIDDAADITFGAVIDPSLQDAIRVTLIAAGMEEMHTSQLPAVRLERPQPRPMQPLPAQTSSGRQAPPRNAPVSSTPGRATPEIPMAPRTLPSRPTGQNTPSAGVPTPTHVPVPSQQLGPSAVPPGRQQRRLEDLRGIRSMGHRYASTKGSQPEHDEDGAIDVPPFLKGQG